MDRGHFEFQCPKCHKYFRVPLDIEEERDVLMKCPGCGREHQRYIRNGEITDSVQGRPIRHGQPESAEVHLIEVPASALSDEPMLRHLEAKGLLGSLWARFGASA